MLNETRHLGSRLAVALPSQPDAAAWLAAVAETHELGSGFQPLHVQTLQRPLSLHPP